MLVDAVRVEVQVADASKCGRDPSSSKLPFYREIELKRDQK